ISDDKDLTIKPRLFNNGITILQSEYRQETKNSLSLIDTSITTGHSSNKNESNGSRTHFFANSKINLGIENFLNSDLEINFEKTSNDTYLKLFNFMKSPLLIGKDNGTLETTIELDLEHEDYDFASSVEMYESLSGGSNSDRYYYTLPSYTFNKIFDLESFGGTFDFSSSGNNSLNQTNVLTTTVNNDLTFSTYDSYLHNGLRKNFEFLLRNINALGKNSTDYKNSPQSELISTYNYNISLPLIKNTENFINRLTPKLSFKVTPHDMKNKSTTDRRMNVNNVFSLDRMGLGNTFETGESLTLGVEFNKERTDNNILDQEEFNKIKEYFDFKLATVFRFNNEKEIPINSTLNKKRSNIFGQINFIPNQFASIKYDFSLTNDLARFENNTLGLELKYNNLTTTFNYVEDAGLLGNTNFIENTTKYNFDEYNSISFGTRRNREINLTEYYDLVYEYKNDCLVADIKYRKDYYNSADITPKEELFFSITIVPFYTYSPDKMILNKNRID
ncbi:organic solvent tolerance protein, partial [Candidatus Pelagibacter sp.]|nr:organic solvent tolerance protein [Candidatus Pelagibacter sp.]